MIPLKEEPTIEATLCFSDEDAQALQSCQTYLATAGNVVLASARHENLLAHYTRTLLANLNATSNNTVAIRRMPNSSDGLLQCLNEHLADLEISALQAKRVVKTREIWLYELPGPAESELLQMAAKMIGQFKAAGVSIVVHSRQARPDSPHLQKLATRMRAKQVVFQNPTEEQCRALADKARGTAEAPQVNQLIASLGISLPQEDAATVAQPSPLSNLMQQAGKKLPKPVAKPQERAPTSTSKSAPGPALKGPASGVSNTRILVSSGIASALIVALYLSPGVDPFSAFDKGVTWIQSISSASPDATPPVQDLGQKPKAQVIALNPVRPEVSADEPAPVATPGPDPVMVPTLPAPGETAGDVIAAETAASTAASEPLDRASSDEASLTALFPVPSPKTPVVQASAASGINVEPGVYVQHASFRLPQSALIWKNNNVQIPGVKVFAKGERFVTVSGPFLDRGQATEYLAEFGITARPYFISADVLTVRS